MRPKDTHTQTVLKGMRCALKHTELTKKTLTTPSFFFLIMSIDLMISALRQGKTGEQILSILDAITSDSDANADAAQDAQFVYAPILQQNVPTLEEIAF